MRVKAALGRLEALWWMTRLHSHTGIFWYALIGWTSAAGASAVVPRLGWFLLAVASAGGALLVHNDLDDHEADKVTAPYHPLPDGLVTRKQASLAALVLLGAAVASLVASCTDARELLACVAMTVVAVAATRVYSAVKRRPLLAMAVATIPYALLPLSMGWLLAGRTSAALYLTLVAYAGISGVANTILGALRDVDTDGAVGQRTIAVVLGGARALGWAVGVGAAAFLPLAAAMWLTRPTPASLLFGATAVLLTALSFTRTARAFRRDGTRAQRIRELRAVKVAEYLRHAAMVAVFSPGLALIAAVALIVRRVAGQELHRRRIVHRGLKRSLDGPRMSAALRRPAGQGNADA